MSVVAFDEVLDVVHLLDDASPELGCPRGAPRLELPYPGSTPANGRLLVVHPCGLPAGHDGPCEPATRKQERQKRRTRCGRRVDALWIDWPWGGRACPACKRARG